MVASNPGGVRGRELVDLSHHIKNDMFHSPEYPAPSITQLTSIDTHGMSITHASFHAHTGTHVDAPSHFIRGGESITEISLDRFVGDGLMVSIYRQAGEEIPASDVVPQVRAFGPNAMLCLHSGWDRTLPLRSTASIPTSRSSLPTRSWRSRCGCLR
jgi:kynurenine formamidase